MRYGSVLDLKEPDLQKQLDHRCAPMLVAIALYTNRWVTRTMGRALFVTSGLRLGDKGVHGVGRGLDFRVTTNGLFTHKEADQIAAFINRTWMYDPYRRWLKIAIFGALDPKGKHNDHIHIQVHPRTKARRV